MKDLRDVIENKVEAEGRVHDEVQCGCEHIICFVKILFKVNSSLHPIICEISSNPMLYVEVYHNLVINRDMNIKARQNYIACQFGNR